MAYVNGRAYDASQVQVKFAGMNKPFAGFKSISYDDPQEMEMNFGIGNEAVSYGFGNITPEVTLTITADEVRELIDSSPNGRLQDRPLEDLIVTFQHPNSNRIVTDIIKFCKIRNTPMEINQNDKEFEVELDIMSPQIVRGQR